MSNEMSASRKRIENILKADLQPDVVGCKVFDNGSAVRVIQVRLDGLDGLLFLDKTEYFRGLSLFGIWN